MLRFIDLTSVDNLVVYKKSLKNRMVGLRWSYSQNENLDGFIISFNEITSTHFKNITIIPPTKCLAWPELYCHEFYTNFSLNNKYEIKVSI